ncbi:MAG TPA: GGDEF domain-containing protein, partial [Sphaerochaeta sp.]|nr:GGDEF domain-containing protein [Sphaerochaeta sp.]
TTTHHYIETRLQHKQSSETDYCILFDLDDFKSVNDTMGHLAGNKVLEAIGDVLLQSNHTHADIIGRVGGDEFCIYLVAVQSEKAALSYCASLLEAVRVRFSDDQVTISMGMARVAEKDTYETLYTRVDFAMYQAKSKGKNRLEIVDTQTNTRT